MFMIKRKKYQFSVDLILNELSSVPLITGLLFAKIRLIDDRNVHYTSTREEVKEHCVKWDTRLHFNCKMTANPANGVLDSKVLRISIRKEAKGGRSFLKLGFVDIDLAEFAGSGLQKRRYLLEGYDAKHRQDNSTLLITIEMSLLIGDPLFKRPSKSHFYTTNSMETDILSNSASSGTVVNDTTTNDLNSSGSIRPHHLNHNRNNESILDTMRTEQNLNNENVINPASTVVNRIIASTIATNTATTAAAAATASNTLNAHNSVHLDDCYSGSSVSSGFGSLPRALTSDKRTLIDEKLLEKNLCNTNDGYRSLPFVTGNLHNKDEFEYGHSRNASTNSQKSIVASAGYGSLPSHSRQGSTDSGKISRNPSSASGLSDSTRFNSTERKQKVERSLLNKAPESETRVESTRVDENNFVDVFFKEVLNTTNNDDEIECNEEIKNYDGNLHIRYEKDGRVTLSSTSKGSALISTLKHNNNNNNNNNDSSKEISSTNSSRQSSSDRDTTDSHL